MAWKTPAGGIGGFNAGFDQSGGETWQQAKATQMGDKGLWTDKWFDQRTDMAQDYNQLLKDRNRLGEGYIDRAGIGLNTEEKFFNQYPNIPRTFKPFEDLEEQMNIGEFPKKAPPGYFDKWGAAGGGIASLENRPGYRWGGSPNLDQTGGDFGVDWDRGYGKRFNDLVMLESRLKQPTGRLLADTVKTTWQNELMHGDSDRRYDFAIDRATDYGKSLDENMSLTQSQRDELEDYIASFNPMAFRADGGAVGLEPGIGSLMGYAKGGMVTKVKVPKGQSKWMKRFVNNMRDS